MMKRADQLRPGDLCDLEGDKYADPHREHDELEFEFIEVADVTPETPNCVAVGFEGFDVVGFPPDHLIFVRD